MSNNLALYRVLVAAGASEAEAEAAARLDVSELATKADLAELRGDLKTVSWMMGTLIVLQIGFGLGNLWLVLNLMSRLGATP